MPDFLQELSQPLRSVREIPRRIELCRQALRMIGPEGDVATRAARALILGELANYLTETPEGSPVDNLEQAIAHFKEALGICTRQTDSKSWAALQTNLAAAYMMRIRGERADNIEQAIACSDQALEVTSREDDPQIWASMQNNRGRFYIERVLGKRDENLNKAIEILCQALEVRKQEINPAEWADTEQNLALAYSKKRDISQAIKHYGEALKVFTREVDSDRWAQIHMELGAVCAQNKLFEEAIAHLEKALEVHTREGHPYLWATGHTALGWVYSAIRGDRANKLEQAIAHYEEALTVYTPEANPEQWAETSIALASAHKFRVRGERADNLERARRLALRAQRIYTREAYPEYWAKTETLIGEIYQERILGDPVDNVGQAIAHYQMALGVYTPDRHPYEWVVCQIDLGNAYMGSGAGEDADNFEQAIAHFEHALDVCTREAYADQWGRTQHNLGVAYSKRIRGERAENLEQAIAHYQEALKVRTRQAYPVQWATTQNNLALAYTERICGERAENLEQAIAHYRLALEVRTLEQFPADFQETQHHLGRLHFGERQWAKALAALREAIGADKVLLAAAYTEVGRRSAVAQTSRLYPIAAYALAKLGRPGEALAQLEQGKTRLLSSALAVDELDLSILPSKDQETLHSLRETIRKLNASRRPGDEPGAQTEVELILSPNGRVTPRYREVLTFEDLAVDNARLRLNETIDRIRQANPDFLPEGLALAEILALIPKDTVLIAPAITAQGSAVFVVPAGMQSVSSEEVLWLEEFTDENLRTLLLDEQSGWLVASISARTDAKAWRDTIETTGQVLWDRLMGPIAERLASLDAKHVLLLPQGGLGLLPLHAAWREVDGDRRYVLDDYIVTYIPSAYARRVSEDRLHDTQRQARTLLAVINPTEDLPFTPAEGEQVANLFGEDKSTLLPGSKATPKTVKQGLASYLHFACHGFYEWRDPMRSGLVLAGGETLSLSQIIRQLNLDANRLVTLSACETGITDVIQSPDEFLGLPSGFLQAGAPAVVSTLWAVNDLSTMLLMERFYQLHLEDGHDLPEALRGAQTWLREVSAGELANRFRDEEDAALRGNPRMPIERASAYYARFEVEDPAHRPFAHPFHWAAFTFSGA